MSSPVDIVRNIVSRLDRIKEASTDKLHRILEEIEVGEYKPLSGTKLQDLLYDLSLQLEDIDHRAARFIEETGYIISKLYDVVLEELRRRGKR